MRTLMALSLMALAACGTSNTAEVSPDGRFVDVDISSGGYTPAEINATPGESLNLVFFRADANNCGGTVVFPDTGKKVEVPVGEKVTVGVKAPESGNLAFTCDMNMYKGTVVVAAH